MRGSCAALAALLVSLLAHGARADSFDPKKTFAVVAGVLEWTDADFPSFPKEKRKDQELYDTLAKRGVPAAQQILLLDAQATSANITAAIRKLVKAAPKGATFLFYYAGHGVKREDGEIVFASREISSANLDHTGFHLKDLPGLLAGFAGSRVILLADCCYSGGLGQVASAVKQPGRSVVALTSSEASNSSTGNWTYTQMLIDGLNGRAIADRDGNGSISLAEVAAEVEDAMRHREYQRYGYTNLGVAPGLVLAKAERSPKGLATGKGALARRAWVLAGSGESAEPARILGSKDDQLLLWFYDYASETDTWTKSADTRPMTFKTYPVGADIDVTWEKDTYEAKVLKVDNGFQWITYPGYEASYDEWVAEDRVLGAHDAKTSKAEQKVQVEWNGQWWSAVVQSKKGSQTCIHYVGYDDKWNECVPPARVRAL